MPRINHPSSPARLFVGHVEGGKEVVGGFIGRNIYFVGGRRCLPTADLARVNANRFVAHGNRDAFLCRPFRAVVP